MKHYNATYETSHMYTCENYNCSMKCFYDMTLDAYALWCSWSSFNCILTSGMLQWQNHPNYMAHMHLSLSLRPLIAAHESQITRIVCWVSSKNLKSSIFYNSYMINMELLQHYNSWYEITYISVQKTYNISLQNMFKSKLNLSSKRWVRLQKQLSWSI